MHNMHAQPLTHGTATAAAAADHTRLLALHTSWKLCAQRHTSDSHCCATTAAHADTPYTLAHTHMKHPVG
eukprot:12860-Heterococcus_DN1.PRE.1